MPEAAGSSPEEINARAKKLRACAVQWPALDDLGGVADEGRWRQQPCLFSVCLSLSAWEAVSVSCYWQQRAASDYMYVRAVVGDDDDGSGGRYMYQMAAGGDVKAAAFWRGYHINISVKC